MSEPKPMRECVAEWMESLESRAANGVPDLIRRIQNPSHRWDRLAAIRKLYGLMDEDEWRSAYPFGFDWEPVLTPIEAPVWDDIRSSPLFMAPQYPAGRFFLDFADPDARIAIECDGAQWHDAKRDRARDWELLEMGWTVFRISGRECLRCWSPEFDEDVPQDFREEGQTATTAETLRWLRCTSEGLLSAIGCVFFGRGSQGYTHGEALALLNARVLTGVPVEVTCARLMGAPI